MISVGLTGGIGSGKSTVAKLFSGLGIPVYDSDARAKTLMVTDSELISKIKQILGDKSFIGEVLNKEFIAQSIFENKTLRDELNNAIHAAVFVDYITFAKAQINAPFIIQESAILFECGYNNRYDLMITVVSPDDIKIKRLLDKGMRKNDILLRMKSQWPDSKKKEQSDYVIFNDEENSLISQVSDIYNKILMKYL